MITKEKAIQIAQAKLDSFPKYWPKSVLILDKMRETELLWIFFYTIENRDGSWALYVGGNAPVIVSKQDGRLCETGTSHPVEYFIRNAERKIKGIRLFTIEDFDTEVWKLLIHFKSPVAAAIPAHNPSRNLKWMAIYPCREFDEDGLDFFEFRVFEIELPRELIGRKKWEEKDQLTAETLLRNEMELMELLTDRSISPALFVAPAICHYPCA